ncbi:MULTISPECIES: Gfo/Idh/MocA family oxidoreductase [unclassified Rhizobium]|uniref:Gfo/Idh/MocA family protein n=1 Tax=unclassified Rhizobium TaxID=2613769 RepID=UPI000BE7DB01|nr:MULTISPECIES: Gfo/Idh/MocA family oxidoreductase [unclassified Rhizobium]MDF0661694.1 Gfo/Idh/MocA family oxidoreductase [Rhizobium sp. BC49]PDS87508.1 fructose reductase [Rhizobium sp. L18]
MKKKVKWGLIGASRIAAEWVMPAIREATDSEVVAVQGSDKDRVETYARAHGIPLAFSSVDDLLASDVDAVYISNTNEKHAPCAIRALQAGKHVLDEKPMAMSVKDAQAMVGLASDKGLVLGVNHHLRSMNSHRKLRELVADGVLGDLVAVRIMFGVLLPQANRGWRTESADAGAGVFFDLSVHDADLLHFVLGEKIVQIAAFTSNNGISSQGIEDTVAAIARTESGLLVQITESFAMPHAKTTFELHGTKASAFAEDVLLQRAGGTISLSIDGSRVPVAVEHSNAYPRVINAFNDSIRGEGRPVVTGEDGLASLKLAIAAREAARTGQVIAVDTMR